MKPSTLQRITLFIFLMFTVWLSFYIIQPPEPKPETSSETSFSAERAFKHVQEIAQKPRPLGSAANDSARQYIQDQLTQMGLETSVQKGVSASSRFGNSIVGYPENIIAKIDGQNPEKTLLLMTHYDSVPNSPGAADDAAGVAAILEAVRAIKSQETPLKNNIWVLITDGEERGLLGAELFVDSFTDLEQIDLVLNFEARGSSGASMMFETSSPNSKLIPHFANATPDPVANSLMYTVYKIMPNDTDLSVLKRSGLNGLNFAFAKDYLNYHTMQDNPQNLSGASLQHHGTNLLGNVRYFDNQNVDLDSNTEYVYFNNATGGLIYYPSSWSFPLAVITGLLFLVYLIYLFRTTQLTFGSYLGSTLLFILITTVAAAVTYFGWQAFKLIHPQYQWLIQGETYAHNWYLWGFFLLVLALFSVIYGLHWIQKKLSMQKLLAGSYTVWIVFALATAWHLPTASYILTWPVLMALFGWIALGHDINQLSWKSIGIMVVSLGPVLFLIPPYIHLVQVMLTTELLAISMVLVVFILGLAWPLIWQIHRNHKYKWSGGLVIVSVLCFLLAAVNSGYDSEHKKQNDINYIQNINTNQAYWISRDHTSDSWTKQFLGENFEKGSPPNITGFRNNLLYNQAKVRDISLPQFKILSDSTSNSERFISLSVDARESGIGMRIHWPRQVSMKNLKLDDKQIFSKRDSEKERVGPLNSINYFKDISDSTKIDLSFPHTEDSPSISFTFFKMELPTYLISNYEPRASNMMPKPHSFSNASIWQTEVNLDTLDTVP